MTAKTEIRNLYKIGPRLARKIINDLGDGDANLALSIIQSNPYSLTDVTGIAFRRADAVAQHDFGIGLDDPRRHRAGNRSALERDGVVSEAQFDRERTKLGLHNPDYRLDGVEIEDGMVWLPEELDAELSLEDYFRAAGKPQEPVALTEAQQAICDKMGLDDVQRHAVQMALTHPLCAITGGAGTGKTHVIAAIGACLGADNKTMRGAAFAGKAADRMREAFDRYGLPCESSTIHRMLGYHPRTGWGTDPIAADLVVLDEASMLPNILVHVVVEALQSGAHLLLVGDPNQLPPIGYGTPFVDALAYGIPNAHLSKNYRQADQQGILHMAEGILAGKAPASADCVDLRFGVESAALAEVFDELVTAEANAPLDDWQCITWRNEDVERYNLRAQAICNPTGEAIFEYACWKLGTGERGAPKVRAQVRIGDKILITKNDTDRNIFNGMTGRAVGVVTRRRKYWVTVSKLSLAYRQAVGLDSHAELLDYLAIHGEPAVQKNTARISRLGDEEPHIRLDIAGRPVDLPLDDAEDYLQLGYVITVHKAQGSDWPRIIVMQAGQVHRSTAQRWYYTAVTRAKTRLTLVSGLGKVRWWVNATTPAPEVESTLARRLAAADPLATLGTKTGGTKWLGVMAQQ